MAQSALTVTVANPTPPTNFTGTFVGNTPPLDPGQPATDDGTAGALSTFGTNKAATSTGSAPGAGISNAAEGSGSEVTVTATSANPSALGQLTMVSDMGSYTGLITPTSSGVATSSPNTQHASSLNAAGTSTISGLLPATPVHTASPSTTTLTVNGTNFRRDSVVSIGGVKQVTNYVSATQLTVTNAPTLTAAGSTPVIVTTGGVATGATNWTFS